jgi:Cu/Ag efflux protein CusF
MLSCDISSTIDSSRLVWVGHSCPTVGAESSLEREVRTKANLSNVVSFFICLSALLLTSACNQKSQPTEKAAPGVAPAKHYQLKGKVVSIDAQAQMVNVDSEAIPGFMDAMTMPYKVKPDSELDKLHPGDVVTADLLVQDEGARLEHVEVTGHSSPPNTK